MSTIISTIGDEHTYVSLSISRQEGGIELVSVLTHYSAITGDYLTAELACEKVDDEDEAIALATDLEYAAQDELRVMDVDFWKEPCGFPEALEKHFDNVRYAAAIAAE